MIKTLATFFAAIFALGGILGFVPGITQHDMFLGVFMVNTAHSIMHLLSGAIFLIASVAGPRAARFCFQVFGIIYAGVAAMGFMVGDGKIFGLISNNQYDTWGHALLAVLLLVVGFSTSQQSSAA